MLLPIIGYIEKNSNINSDDEFLKNVKRLKNVYMKLFLVLFLIIRTFNGIVAVNHK